MEVKRYFIELSYNGGAYHGWQRQPNAISVQHVLEESLSKLLRENISILGAGRTDTGVHARQMFAHFDLTTVIEDQKELVFLLNGFLPNDIAIKKIHRVISSAHARFDASERSYEYHIASVKDPFYAAFHHYLKNKPDIDLMNQATKILLAYEDLCNIKTAEWRPEGTSLVFYIRANRFLRNMVRAIVGTLLEIGFKKRAVEDMESIIKSRDRSQAGFSAPAKGLYLTEILYPQDLFID
jgi:tRNA pseudouridine38-40 synthase